MQIKLTISDLKSRAIKPCFPRKAQYLKVEDIGTDIKYCNLCGRELDFIDTQSDFTLHKDVIAYGSIHDGDSVNLRMCCKCFDELVSACVLNPIFEKDVNS